MCWLGVTDEVTPFLFVVEDFIHKQNLAKIGYRFPAEGLSDWQVQAFAVIRSQFDKLAKEESKRKG